MASRCWGERLLRGLNAVLLAGLSILFMARFPYYRQFHSGFNQLLFNTGNDDMYALLVSLVQEFYLPLRLLAANGTQTILFTCQRREQKLLEKLGIAYHMIEL